MAMTKTMMLALFISILAMSNSLPDNRVLFKMNSYGNNLENERTLSQPGRIYKIFQRQGIHKRNNAEVVNHILKNFGTLDRLGDVGK